MITKQIKTICFVFVCCNSFLTSFCQESIFSSGLFAGENCSLSLSKNVWAIQTNPAILAFSEQNECGVAYSTNFNVTNMVCSRINACTKMKQVSTAASIVFFGNSHFQESQFNICLARKLNKHNALSLKFNGTRTKNKEFKNSTHVFPEIGYAGESEKMLYGIHIINPLQINSKKKDFHSVFKINCEYSVTPTISVASSIIHSDWATTFALGAIYNYNNKFRCTLTYRNSQNPISLEVVIPFKQFVCDYETTLNYYLGFSHTIAFRYML